MRAGIKLVSLNIERSKHIELVLAFLQREHADVVCMQELVDTDIPQLEELLGPCVAYAPDGFHPADPPQQGAVMTGNGIFTTRAVTAKEVRYYRGSLEATHTSPIQKIPENVGLAMCELEHEHATYRIVTTHFTWTPDGMPSEQQRIDLEALFDILGEYEKFVLTGDFNAPRGGEIWATYMTRYKDNIPSQYMTSLDRTLHRAGHLDLMVDGIFSTPGYRVDDVSLVDGVSDHCAIVATIQKSF